MSILNDTMTLAGGVKIPRLGFGTWPVSYTHLDVYKRQVLYSL